MEQIEFFMAMQPPTVTAQEKRIDTRNGKPIVYEDGALKDARQKLLAHLSAHAPDKPLEGALTLLCIWQWTPSKPERMGRYRIQKPDTDNLQKLLKDCMTRAGFWKDDAQVADERCVKLWTPTPDDPPGIYILIRQTDERYYESYV